MNELQEVLQGVQRLWAQGEPAALATVVRVSGSAYRRPGARMLVSPGGTRLAGMISGGCLEGVVARNAWERTANAAALLRFDSTADEEGAWGLGLGCNGVVEILVERLPKGDPFIDFVQQSLTAGTCGVVSTVFEAGEGSGVPLGAKLLTNDSGSRAAGPISDRWSAQVLAPDARQCLESGRTHSAAYTVNAQRIEVLHERIDPPLRLVVFGAGWDAVPLVETAVSVGWEVTVIDRKASRAMTRRFPGAKDVLAVKPDDLSRLQVLDARTAAILMSHDYEDDLAYLNFAMQRHAWFVGLLGPTRRRDRLLTDLAARVGERLSSEQLQRLYAPVGLDLGAEGPREIALSIVAEIVAVRSGRPGSMLRSRPGPIHE